MKTRLINIVFIVAFVLVGTAVAGFALAQDVGLNFAQNLELPTSNVDARDTLVNIVRFLLTFLALAAVLVIIYAGWLWTTSAGRPDRIDKAKKTLLGAVIGLIISLAAFAIVTFVMNMTTTVLSGCTPGDTRLCGCISAGTQTCQTDSTWGVCSFAGCGTGNVCCPWGCDIDCSIPPSFEINSTSPIDSSSNVIRNAIIRFAFNYGVDNTTVDATTFSVSDSGGSLAGTYNVFGNRVEFTTSQSCPANPCGAPNCFGAGETITVAVDGVLGNGGLVLQGMNHPIFGFITCGDGSGLPCTITFDVGNLIDCQAPQVSLDIGQLCVDPSTALFANSSDDSGIYDLTFYVDGVIVPNIPTGNNPVLNTLNLNPFNTRPFYPSIWDSTIGYSPGDIASISVVATDLDSNQTTDSQNVTLRPDWCCNGVLDTAQGEEGVDCGGQCAACAGAACGASLSDDCTVDLTPGSCRLNDDVCASRYCECITPTSNTCQDLNYDPGVNDCCVCQASPIIDWVSPVGGFCDGNTGTFCRSDADCAAFTPGTCNTATPNGATGNLVTIGGRNFGATLGTVYFADAAGNPTVAAVLANDPTDGNPSCGTDADMWKNNQIIVVVPAGAQDGPMRVEEGTSGNNYFDDTDDIQGALINDFEKNTIVRPGLCNLNPDNGAMDQTIIYQGIRLLSTYPYFGNLSSNIPGNNSSFLANDTGTTEVPNLTRGLTTTFVVDGSSVNSNFLYFTKNQDLSTGPYITSFDPTSGAPGQYVTIYGGGFGRSQSTSEVHFGDELGPEADYDFPDVCADSVWSDNQVIIKVPSIGNNNYIFTMVLPTGQASTTAFFTVDDTLPLLPSLCKIEPIMGPNNSPISLWGEYFGSTADTVRFQLNQDQTGTAITYWGPDTDPEADRIDTTIHQNAVTGPVRAVVGGGAGNSLNLTVGLCTAAPNPDTACGAQICCPADTSEAGRCAATINDCYIPISNSVYEFDFSTISGIACDGDTNTPACEPDNTTCQSNGYDYCDPSTCICQLGTPPCDMDLVTPGCQADDPYCQGLGYDYCNPAIGCLCDNYGAGNSCYGQSQLTSSCPTGFCPNSPGQCSVTPASISLVGNCGDVECQTQFSCSGCTYNGTMDRCVDTSQGLCNMPSDTRYTDVDGVTTMAYCEDYSGTPRWHIYTSKSCPAPGWIMLPGNKCVNTVDSCVLCSPGFACLDDINGDDQGLCSIGQDICPFGSTCNSSNICASNNTVACDCCCEIGFDSRDCCVPLTCAGTCGTGPPYGLCSDCWVDTNGNSTPDTADQAASDAACNCASAAGKFCDMDVDVDGDSIPDGVCRDCEQVASDPIECQSHSTVCCVDAAASNTCRGGDGTILAGAYCPYYDCGTIWPFDCDPTPLTTGTYPDLTECTTDCGSGPILPIGEECILAIYNCNTGLASCGSYLDCMPDLTPPGPSDGCLCCCDPANDLCPTVNPPIPLTCQPDKSPCDGTNRGLCCGCSDDSDCGNISSVGCSLDTCCRQRPTVVATIPLDKPDGSAGDVCRNAVITAEFDRMMRVSSFTGNVIIAGDYGVDSCPASTTYLALDGQIEKKYGWLARAYHQVKNSLDKFLEPILPQRLARAYTLPQAGRNYCAVLGSAGGYNDSSGIGFLQFKPSQVLDADRLYYAIIEGDPDLNDDAAEGITENYGISMNGSTVSPSGGNNTFNGVDYVNAYIWSFRTLPNQANNSGICEIDHVDISPGSYLFQTTVDDLNEVDANPNNTTFDTVKDSDKLYTVVAVSSDDQELSPVSGYAWDWNWLVVNTAVVDISSEPSLAANGDRQLIEAQAGVVDDNTYVQAAVNLIDTFYSSVGNGVTGSSRAYVFICENPWPPVISGSWAPWVDNSTNCTLPLSGCNSTNFEIYYCRDAGVFGTQDDLPAIVDSSAVIRGQTTNIIKEAYFFREATPTATATLAVANSGLGEEVVVSWNKVSDPQVIAYKLYWGANQGNYTNSSEADNSGTTDNTDVTCAATALGITCNISGLNNNTTYYFNITAIYSGMIEGDYFGSDVAVTVSDTTAPAAPIITTAVAREDEIELTWGAVVDADSYEVLYGVTSGGPYGSSQNIGSDTAVIVAGLTNGVTYYFRVRAIDISGNISSYSPSEPALTPFEAPSQLVVVSAGPTTVNLSWDSPGAGVNTTNIYWGTVSGTYTNSVAPGGAPTNYNVTGLTTGQLYYFGVTTENAGGDESGYTNEVSATPN